MDKDLAWRFWILCYNIQNATVVIRHQGKLYQCIFQSRIPGVLELSDPGSNIYILHYNIVFFSTQCRRG